LICPVRLKIAPIRVLWWKKELSKFRSGERKQLNRAKKTNTLGDWARFEEAQSIYKKAIVVAKKESWKTFCKSTESAPEAFSLHTILSKETDVHLGYLKLPNGSYTESMEENEPSYGSSLSGISGVSIGLGGTTKDQGEI